MSIQLISYFCPEEWGVFQIGGYWLLPEEENKSLTPLKKDHGAPSNGTHPEGNAWMRV